MGENDMVECTPQTKKTGGKTTRRMNTPPKRPASVTDQSFTFETEEQKQQIVIDDESDDTDAGGPAVVKPKATWRLRW